MNIRKVFIVDKEFQYPFIFKNIMLLIFTFVLIFIVMSVWENYQTRQGFLLRPPTNAQIMQWAKQNNVDVQSPEYARQFLLQAKVYTFYELMWKPLLIVFVINIIVLLAANLYFSNRIAGPLHRLKKVLRKKVDGQEIYPVCFREGDPFKALAESMNQVLFTKEELEQYKNKTGEKCD